MEKENKELLIQELSMRFPYGVICKTPIGDKPLLALTKSFIYDTIEAYNDYHDDENDIEGWEGGDVEFIRPYLIPISEMSDYEIEELYKAFGFGYVVNNFKLTEEWEKFQDMIKDGDIFIPYPIWIKDFQNGIKFLLKNHFDYQGLIPKGLAIKVTKYHNPYNNQQED